MTDRPLPNPSDNTITRRGFIHATTASTLALTLPHTSTAALRILDKPVKIGVIADLHHDVMHDGLERVQAFVKRMQTVQPDALLQLGDFAYPNAKNSDVIQLFNEAHERTLHVIGNHDTDSGHTKQQCLDIWGMPKRYYTQDVEGLHLLVLAQGSTGDADGPDHGRLSPTTGGRLGREQC